jgi:exonuclease SbcD
VAHAFLAGGEPTESERPLLVGGSELVRATRCRGFAYVALGHLHRPQFVGRSRKIRYSGSLLPYSFDEAGQGRGATLVEVDGQGRCQVQQLDLAPRRPLVVLEGTLAEILDRGEKEPARGYALARLRDAGPVMHAVERIRLHFPNLVHLEREVPAAAAAGPAREPFRLDDLALFDAFFQEMTGAALDDRERAHLAGVLDELGRRDRAAGGEE